MVKPRPYSLQLTQWSPGTIELSTLYGLPGPDGDDLDVGFNGLSSIPDDVKAELPPDCLKAFETALAKEKEWKNRWGTEAQNGLRRPPTIDKGVIS